MSSPRPVPLELGHDWVSLTALVDRYDEAGPRVPCRRGIVPSSAWTSEDAAEQESAAVACRTCSALLACRSYGLAHPREEGVYGGLKPAERRRMARERKSRNE